MEQKRDEEDRNQKILEYLYEKLDSLTRNEKFESWKEDDFSLFVEAHHQFLSDDYKKISEFIKTKS
mgnify:CR=1 FL=1